MFKCFKVFSKTKREVTPLREPLVFTMKKVPPFFEYPAVAEDEMTVEGEGGDGYVFRAAHNNIEYIFKMPKTPEASEYIRLETKTLTDLQRKGMSHPNIVQLQGQIGYELLENEIFYCPVFEYIDGGNLEEYTLTLNGSLSKSEKFYEIYAKLIHALMYIHAQNILHKDIKPGNVMMDQSGNPKIIDFGFACFFSDEVPAWNSGSRNDHLTAEGTVGYIAPECFHSPARRGQYSPASDFYALGVTMARVYLNKFERHGTDARYVAPPAIPKGTTSPATQKLFVNALNQVPGDRLVGPALFNRVEDLRRRFN